MSPVDLTVLRWLARRESASVWMIVEACAMPHDEVLFRLATLTRLQFVASRLDRAIVPPHLVYFVTDDGLRVTGISIMGKQNE